MGLKFDTSTIFSLLDLLSSGFIFCDKKIQSCQSFIRSRVRRVGRHHCQTETGGPHLVQVGVCSPSSHPSTLWSCRKWASEGLPRLKHEPAGKSQAPVPVCMWSSVLASLQSWSPQEVYCPAHLSGLTSPFMQTGKASPQVWEGPNSLRLRCALVLSTYYPTSCNSKGETHAPIALHSGSVLLFVIS
jgi:hypothetical protein